jgi:hypothetical protein
MDDTVNSTHQGMSLKAITILDAPDLNETNFACFYNANDGSSPLNTLTTAYDSAMKTLTIKTTNGTSMRMIDMQWLNFGNNASDLNLCS